MYANNIIYLFILSKFRLFAILADKKGCNEHSLPLCLHRGKGNFSRVYP